MYSSTNFILKLFFRTLWLKSYGACEVRCLMPKIGQFFLRLRGSPLNPSLPTLPLSFVDIRVWTPLALTNRLHAFADSMKKSA
jgi:hypothetical protein